MVFGRACILFIYKFLDRINSLFGILCLQWTCSIWAQPSCQTSSAWVHTVRITCTCFRNVCTSTRNIQAVFCNLKVLSYTTPYQSSTASRLFSRIGIVNLQDVKMFRRILQARERQLAITNPEPKVEWSALQMATLDSCPDVCIVPCFNETNWVWRLDGNTVQSTESPSLKHATLHTRFAWEIK